MNKLIFNKKHFKFILILVFIFVALFLTYMYIRNNPNHQDETILLFTVTDISKNCISNGLKVYSNNKYEIIKGAWVDGENNLIKSGTYDYDIDKLLKSFNNDTCDKEHLFNYSVTLKSGEQYCISMIEDTELNKFLNSLNEENLFWCS